jgi:hypothetical protein
MIGHRRIRSAAFILFATGAVLWLVLPTGSKPEPTDGGIAIVRGVSSPTTLPGGRATLHIAGSAPTEAEPIPIVATDAEVTSADAQSYLVANEKRDRGWADRSEAAIENLMRGIAYVGRGKRLDVKCAASACEVSGVVDVDAATGSFTPVWTALERDTAGDQLQKFGLERTSALFDTGRNPDEFEIFYRRVDLQPIQDRGHFE